MDIERSFTLPSLCCILVFFLCLSLLPVVVTAGEKRLTVAAASNLAFAMKEISAQFERETGIETVVSFGSTGKLAQQIENGAPFDLFFAANARYIDDLSRKGFIITNTQRIYAQGRIVLAANKREGVDVKELEDLLDPSVKRIAIANPNHAPYGIAAKEALLSKGLWDKVKPKLVYGENIRQALQFIQTGNATAGIVALSIVDVPEVGHTPIDASLHNPINQAVAVIKGSEHKNEAISFIRYVNSPAGSEIMKKYGLLPTGDLQDMS